MVSADSLSSITSTAFKYMSASTINSLTITQLTGLSVEQAVAFQQSPYYSYFSNTITSVLKSSIAGVTTTFTVSNASVKVFDYYFNFIATLLVSFLIFKQWKWMYSSFIKKTIIYS